MEAVAHEFVHASFQSGQLGRLTDPAAFDRYNAVTEPRWLTEGMAYLLARLVTLEPRGFSYSRERERLVLQAASIGLPLWEADGWPEKWADHQTPNEIIARTYTCGCLAAELLASHFGIANLANYYMLLEPQMAPLGGDPARYPRPGWRISFQRAFGIAVEEFYELFEAQPAAGFPEVDFVN